MRTILALLMLSAPPISQAWECPGAVDGYEPVLEVYSAATDVVLGVSLATSLVDLSEGREDSWDNDVRTTFRVLKTLKGDLEGDLEFTYGLDPPNKPLWVGRTFLLMLEDARYSFCSWSMLVSSTTIEGLIEEFGSELSYPREIPSEAVQYAAREAEHRELRDLILLLKRLEQ